MLNSVIRTIGLSLIIAAFFLMGCSKGTTPIVPSDNSNSPDQTETYNGGMSLGEYALYLDSETLEAKIEPANRENAIDVTSFAQIQVMGLNWDPMTRVWDIDVHITNPTKYTAFGPWVVFRNIGDQMLLNQDGFTYWQISPGGPTIRVPVKAFAKGNPERVWPANTMEYLHLQIHWPDGWNSWSPLYFIIDVSYPGPRQEPIVEELTLTPSMIPENMNLTAFVWDWQAPPPMQPNVNVFVDLTRIGGPYDEPMFDDGMHNDGLAGDGVFGCSFYAMYPDPAVLTVYADDWESYHFENDIGLNWGPPPCLPMEMIDQGNHGFYAPIEMIVRDFGLWENVWREIHPDAPIPMIDFSVHQAVVVGLAPRPSTGFGVHIDCVQQMFSPSGPQTLVDYTEEIPGPDCQVLWVITNPYQIVITPRTEGEGNFNHMEHVYNCQPPDCVPIRPLANGAHSNLHEPVEEMFFEQDSWELFWHVHNYMQSAPDVDWTNEYVIALMTGDRMTGGYWIRPDCVQLLEDPSFGRVTLVNYTEMIPGPDCLVPDVITQPFFFFAVPIQDGTRPDFIKHEEVYSCEPAPCVPMERIAQGSHSGLQEPYTSIIRDQSAWEMFWMLHNPDETPPEINFENQMAVVTFIGERPSSGYICMINCVRFLENDPMNPHIVVEYAEHIPGASCITMPVITQPFDIMVVPRWDAPDEFMMNSITYECQ